MNRTGLPSKHINLLPALKPLTFPSSLTLLPLPEPAQQTGGTMQVYRRLTKLSKSLTVLLLSKPVVSSQKIHRENLWNQLCMTFLI